MALGRTLCLLGCKMVLQLMGLLYGNFCSFIPALWTLFVSRIQLIMWDFTFSLEFFPHWVNLFAYSFNARLLWRERTGQSMKSHSVTHWWSKWDILKQVSDYFGDVVPFLHEYQNLSPSTLGFLEKKHSFSNPALPLPRGHLVYPAPFHPSRKAP